MLFGQENIFQSMGYITTYSGDLSTARAYVLR